MSVLLTKDELADLLEERIDVFVQQLLERNKKSDLSVRFRLNTRDGEWRDGEVYVENDPVIGKELGRVINQAAVNGAFALIDTITSTARLEPSRDELLTGDELLVQIHNRVKRLTDALIDGIPPSGTPMSDPDESVDD